MKGPRTILLVGSGLLIVLAFAIPRSSKWRSIASALMGLPPDAEQAMLVSLSNVLLGALMALMDRHGESVYELDSRIAS